MTAPLVLIVGRLTAAAEGVRGEPYAAGRRYLESIARAGAIPLMLPPITSLADTVHDVLARVDAVVLHGGGDVDPQRYGQAPATDRLYGVVPEHDEVELAVVTAALARDMPLLAICRGMQVLNVALGGTLQQHIGSEDHWFALHPVELTAGCRLAAAIGSTTVAAAHCVHHQALDLVAADLQVVGRTSDGLVHACELTAARWVVATQWHPEDTAADDPEQQALFEALVAQAR